MHFLDLDARKAADATCDQDAFRFLFEGTRALARTSDGVRKTYAYALDQWLLEDAANYHWLGLFCDCLSSRPGCHTYYTRVKSLRLSVPDIRLHNLTPFPYVNYPIETDPARIVAAYRSSYVQSRWSYAEWSAIGCPGWFLRLGNTILPERDRSSFLLRVQPAGPRSPDNQGSLLPQRQDVRDGPVGEIAGRDGDKIILWE